MSRDQLSLFKDPWILSESRSLKGGPKLLEGFEEMLQRSLSVLAANVAVNYLISFI